MPVFSCVYVSVSLVYVSVSLGLCQRLAGESNRFVMVEVTINQEIFLLPSAAVLADVLPLLEIRHLDGVAIAVNGVVIAKPEWEGYGLEAGDEVFIIRATAGG